MRKTGTRLADGRELVYYDSGAVTKTRTARDCRHLDAVQLGSELRYDPVLGSWVMYASHRQDRDYLPSVEDCPLCPSTEAHLTEVPDDDYEVVVFENRFPALGAAPPGLGPPTGGSSGHTAPGAIGIAQAPLLLQRPPAGRCEVVCYTSDHDAAFGGLSPERVDLVLEALIDRTAELQRIPGVEQVFCFENRGREIGVTQPHPHGQIYAYPFITRRTQSMLASSRAHRQRTGGNLFDDLVAAERAAGSRLVVTTQFWTAFVPYASRWPYQVQCYPNARVPDLASLGSGARSELPQVLLDLFGRFGRLFDRPTPYIAGWHQAPRRLGRDDFALCFELFTIQRANGKLKYLAGSESAMEAFANDVMPESAAARLRDLGAGTTLSGRPARTT